MINTLSILAIGFCLLLLLHCVTKLLLNPGEFIVGSCGLRRILAQKVYDLLIEADYKVKKVGGGSNTLNYTLVYKG